MTEPAYQQRPLSPEIHSKSNWTDVTGTSSAFHAGALM